MIHPRPYLSEFLDYVFEHFNVSIWSAGKPYYIEAIVNTLILNSQNRTLDFVFTCEETDAGLKNLDTVYDVCPEYNDCNTILIDDNNIQTEFNPLNSVLIKPFDQPKGDDIFLLTLMYQLSNIKDVDDVRPEIGSLQATQE